MSLRPGGAKRLEGTLGVLQFRKFRNQDAPGITEVWNEAFTGRGAPRLRHSSILENYVYSKPYFDPRGLLVSVRTTALSDCPRRLRPNRRRVAARSRSRS